MSDWYKKDIADVFKELKSNEEGLTHTEAEKRLKEFGPNQVEEKKRMSDFLLLLSQFKSILIIILIIAIVISFFLGEILDAMVILLIIIVNAILGFVQSRKAEKALESLKRLAAPNAEVIRSAEKEIIQAPKLVPGDVILLKVGDKVPADCRIIEEMNLKVDESVLTGESLSVEKTTEAIEDVPEKSNMLFSGTTIVYGRCKAVVTETGMKTEFGRIAGMLQEKEEKTPLEKKLDIFGKNLGIFLIGICVIIFLIGAIFGADVFDMFLLSVSLAVAAVPEAMPAVVTITLAIGVSRMVKKNSIIRSLPAVETLGSTTLICSDKTGTLTKDELVVKKLYVNGKIIDVTGEGYSTKGDFFENSKKAALDEDSRLMLRIGMLCNDAVIGKEAIGDPTEIALVVSAKKAGLEPTGERIDEIPFDSERKMMSVLHLDKKKFVYTKGAVENILKLCTHYRYNGHIKKMTETYRKKILEMNHEFASSALRVLGFAYRISNKMEEKSLIFVGMQGMIDSPREEVKEAIEKCKKAGIRVVMITGDHKDTAVAIAKELKIDNGQVLTGEELDALNDEQFSEAVDNVAVYARVSPEHKVRITNALKNEGHIIAMTGDGVNDAPALKKADRGIAMGITGTDVSKEASDMILTDDNFSSIVAAIEEGRGVYDNIKKFIRYMLSTNIGEILTIFTAILIAMMSGYGVIFILVPAQILWMNLLTDGLVAISLGFEPSEPNIMSRKPRNPKEGVMTKGFLLYIFFIGSVICIGSLYLFFSELDPGLGNIDRARTIAFSTLIMFQLFRGLGSRSDLPMNKIGFFTNKRLLIAIASSVILLLMIIYLPIFNPLFKTVPLNIIDWLRILVVSSSIFIILEIWKFFRNRSSSE
jgi:Ca2+-transporting ATPase